LFVDGFAGKATGEHGRDTGNGIEPLAEGGAVVVVGEAQIEFRAEGGRQAGDFSLASHNYLFCYGARGAIQ
jgi:hypothetical protein